MKSLIPRSPSVPLAPARALRAIATSAGRRELPGYVRLDEVEAACAPLKPRPRAFVRFLWITGARCSEALAVRVRDIDFRAKLAELTTLKRKGRPVRTCPLAASDLGELAVLINSLGLGPDARLFPWSRSRAFEIVRDAFVSAGVDRPRAHPHAIRHGHAVHALQHGAALNIVQRALGHASIVTTSTYLAVTGDDVRASYSTIPW